MGAPQFCQLHLSAATRIHHDDEFYHDIVNRLFWQFSSGFINGWTNKVCTISTGYSRFSKNFLLRLQFSNDSSPLCYHDRPAEIFISAAAAHQVTRDITKISAEFGTKTGRLVSTKIPSKSWYFWPFRRAATMTRDSRIIQYTDKQSEAKSGVKFQTLNFEAFDWTSESKWYSKQECLENAHCYETSYNSW
jgi:hypothetical protein